MSDLTQAVTSRGPARTLMFVLAVVGLGVSGLATGPRDARGASPTDGSVTAGVFSRERLGLRSDEAYVAALVGSDADADVGTAAWSIPMTADEMEQVDLAGRTAFLRQAEADLIPFVQGLDTFAGMWQDQRHGGRLVVLLTDVDPSVTARIEEHAPEDSLGIKVVQAKHTYMRSWSGRRAV